MAIRIEPAIFLFNLIASSQRLPGIEPGSVDVNAGRQSRCGGSYQFGIDVSFVSQAFMGLDTGCIQTRRRIPLGRNLISCLRTASGTGIRNQALNE